MVAAIGRDAHEGLAHEAGDDVELARHLRADLAIGGQPVGGPQRVVIGEVELELAGRILVIALDHVEAHLAAIVDDPHIDGAQALELVDVIAIGIGIAAVRLAVLVLLEPHHLRLGAVPKLEPVILLELVVDAAEIAAASAVRKAPGSLALLAVAEQRAPHARHPLVPGQLHEGLGLGDADQLGRLRPVAEIFAAAVDEEIHGGAIDELEALLGDALPMVGRDALAHDAAGDRDELQIEIVDAELVDLLADLLDQLLALRVLDELLDVSRPHAVDVMFITPLYTQLHGNGLLEYGCKLALGIARKAERLEQRALLAHQLLRHQLADADHLVAVIGIGNDIDILAEHIEDREIVRREAAEPARLLVLLVERDLALEPLLAMRQHRAPRLDEVVADDEIG